MKRRVWQMLIVLSFLFASAIACGDGKVSPQGGTITSVQPTAGGGLVGGAASGHATLGLLTTCATGEGLVWSGTAWGCGPTGGVGTLTGTGSADYLAAWSGAHTLTYRSTKDNGTAFTVGGSFSVAASTGFASAGKLVAPIFNTGTVYGPITLALGQTDNWNPGVDLSAFVVEANASGSTISGMVCPASGAGTHLHLIVGSSSGPLTILHASGASLPANDIYSFDGQDLELQPSSAVDMISICTTGHAWLVTAVATDRYQNLAARALQIPHPLDITIGSGPIDNWDMGLASSSPTPGNPDKYSRVRVTTPIGGSTITGILAPLNRWGDGHVLVIQNLGDGSHTSATLTLKYYNAGSINDDKIITPDAADVVVPLFGIATLVYDKGYNLWFVQSVYTGTAAGGDITAVVAGAGLINGGTSGSVTLDVACLTGLGCNADSIQIADRDFGDITTTSSGSTWTIDPNVVTYAKMQDVTATSRFIGRITSGAGDPEELTGTQATTLLDAFTSGLKGLAPASGGGSTNFLRADGTWAAPAGGGSVTSVATGSGLTGGTITTTGTLKIRTDCTGTYVLAWNSGGSTWDCTQPTALSGVGDITGVTAGTNLTGGGTSGTVTLNVADTISLAGAANTDTITSLNTAAAQTTGISAITAYAHGTYNTTAGGLNNVTLNANAAATRASGANALTNIGLLANAASGQTNLAIYTLAGDVWLNATSGQTVAYGNTVFGDATTDTTTITGAVSIAGPVGTALTVDHTVFVATTAGSSYALDVGRDTGATTNAENGFRVTPFSDGNVYIDSKSITSGTTVFRAGAGAQAGSTTTWLTVSNGTGNAAFSGSTTLGDTTADVVTAWGAINLTADPAGTGVASSYTGSANTTDGSRAGYFRALGTSNTTAGALIQYGLTSAATGTRSAGANNLTNIAISANASGGQINYSFNGIAGKFFNAGDAEIDGNTQLGDASGDVLDVNGDLTKFSTTNGDGWTYIDSVGLNFAYATNGSATGYINYNGYNDGATQYRNLIVGDGAHSTIATFTGATKATEFAGPLTADVTAEIVGDFQADGTTTLGNGGTGDTVNISGGQFKDTGAHPTSFSGCGTGASATGGRWAFTVTTGSSPTTSCAITFSTAFAATPTCTAAGINKTGIAIGARSASSITISDPSATASAVFDVICIGH